MLDESLDILNSTGQVLLNGFISMDLQWQSQGKGNKKNSNKYLSWAFSEAAELARRFDDQARA